MSSIFTKIIQGEIPCYKVYEDDQIFAFLDIRPMQLGHTLVVPKDEIDHIDDLDASTYGALFSAVQKVAKALKASIGCQRVGIMVEGMEVLHAHVHVVPINEPGDLGFHNSKARQEDEMKTTHQALLAALSN